MNNEEPMRYKSSMDLPRDEVVDLTINKTANKLSDAFVEKYGGTVIKKVYRVIENFIRSKKMKGSKNANSHKHAAKYIAKQFRALDHKIDGKIEYEKTRREELEAQVDNLSRRIERLDNKIEFAVDLQEETSDRQATIIVLVVAAIVLTMLLHIF